MDVYTANNITCRLNKFGRHLWCGSNFVLRYHNIHQRILILKVMELTVGYKLPQLLAWIDFVVRGSKATTVSTLNES